MDYLKTLKYYYSLSAIFLTLALYLLDPGLCKAFFCGSCAWLVYIYLLGFSFENFLANSAIISAALDNSVENNNGFDKKIKILVSILAGLRMALMAGVFAIFILKFKLNLAGLFGSFLLYKLVLFLVGLNYAAYNRRNTRQDSTH